jgi:hypothetical protein
MSKSFCFTNMPLDVEEHVFRLDRDALARELGHLDHNGWNTLGQVRKSAITRWAMITAMIREEVLEVLLGRNPSNVAQRIRYV